MPIIRVKDNENNRWKRNAKTKNKTKKIKTESNKGEMEAIVKGWELNEFLVHLS